MLSFHVKLNSEFTIRSYGNSCIFYKIPHVLEPKCYYPNCPLIYKFCYYQIMYIILYSHNPHESKLV